MSIKKVEMYTVKCDNCGKNSGDNRETCAWTDDITALEDAESQDWFVKYNKHYCPDCYYVNEQDYIMIKN